MTTGSSLWYLSRGTGVVSLVLLTLVMTLGILTRGGRRLPGLPTSSVTMLHRNASLLALAFLAVHISTAIIDPYVTINIVDAFVPFGSDYQPLWLGLGALALDLGLALVITSLVRVRLGLRAWRAVHWAAYAMWPLILVHGFVMGPDIRSGWLLGLSVSCVALVGVAATWRLIAVPASAKPSGTRPMGAKSVGVR